MEPIVDGLAQEFAAQVTVWRVNADTEEGTAWQNALEVRGHPTIVLLDENGRVWERFYGVQPADVLRQALQAMLVAQGQS